jgi:hypothetical protein
MMIGRSAALLHSCCVKILMYAVRNVSGGFNVTRRDVRIGDLAPAQHPFSQDPRQPGVLHDHLERSSVRIGIKMPESAQEMEDFFRVSK